MADFGIGEGLAALGLGSAAAADTAATTATVAGFAADAGAGVAATAIPAATTASVLPSLSTIGTVASVGGTLLSAKAGADNAAYQEAVDRANAVALTQKANQDAASGEQVAIARQRQTQLALSRGQAVAAASGGGATDPTVLDVEGQVAGQGTYNALSGLYQGQAAARSDTEQAGIDLFKAQNTEAGAPLALGGTILSGLSSFVDKRLDFTAASRRGASPCRFARGLRA
jgi:hypothetical protein